jgi:hypothetical protein
VALVLPLPYKYACLPCSYYCLEEIKKYGIGMSSCAIMFVSSFVEVSVLVQKFKFEVLFWCWPVHTEETLVRIAGALAEIQNRHLLITKLQYYSYTILFSLLYCDVFQ